MKYAFGDCEIDTELFQLTRAGQPMRLTGQTARLLTFLITNRDRVVLKDELAVAVWDRRIITDATLSTAIKEARLAVGDTGRAQQVIRTVHGQGFQFIADLQPAAPVAAPGGRTVIAILPFRSLGVDPDDRFIADGLTEDTIANLARFRHLFLLSHRTTRHLAADGPSLLDLHVQHGVDYVIEGSLRRSADRLRVTVQVSDAAGGLLLATEQIDRECSIAALFDIQEEVARLIAGRVASRHGVLADHVTAARAGQQPSWDTYLQVARFYEYYRTYDPALHASVRDQLPDTLARDPTSSDGWAAYAILLLEEYRYHINQRPNVDALGLCAAAARRAVDCDNRNAFAQMALALATFYQRNISGFRSIAARALELNAGHSDVLAEIGSCHLFLGEYDRAVELLDQAIALSPVHPGWYHYARCWYHANRQEFESALQEIEEVPMPEFFWYHAHLAWLHAELGQTAAARAAADVMRQMYPGFEAVAYEELALTNIDRDRATPVVAAWRRAGLDIPD